MLKTSQLVGFNRKVLVPKRASFRASSSGNPAAVESVSLNAGRPHPDRLLVLGIATSNNSSSTTNASSVTIDGVAATMAVGVTHGGNSNNPGCGIWYARVKDGDNVTVEVDFGQDPESYVFSLYRLQGLRSFTPYATASDNNGMILSVDVPAQGGLLVGASCGSVAPWTDLTVDFNTTFNSLEHKTAHTPTMFENLTGYNPTNSTDNNANMTSCVAVWS